MIAAAFRAACAAELDAPKPGNVHRFAGGHGMAVADFLASAAAAAGPLCTPGGGLGARILGAVEATRAAVGQNTNLGIVLLAAPLAMAAEEQGGTLRARLSRVLADAGRADAQAAFRAIVLAAPAGLEAAAHDVRAPARVRLSTAMAAAAGRDRIAWNWAHGFADVFEIGLPALAAAPGPWPALAAYLCFLVAFPDSHVMRKHGTDAATALQAAARPWPARLAAAADPVALLPALLDWDAALKRQGINPGTSADLTVASLFARQLLDLEGAS
jgi:triphosphoribosyl-dephospho-CoA synthase